MERHRKNVFSAIIIGSPNLLMEGLDGMSIHVVAWKGTATGIERRRVGPEHGHCHPACSIFHQVGSEKSLLHDSEVSSLKSAEDQGCAHEI